MLPAFHGRGYSTLVIDYRNDPGAPVDTTGRYRFGLGEWEDLEAAVGLIGGRGVDHLVVGGCSTGAAVVMAFLEHSELSGQHRDDAQDAVRLRAQAADLALRTGTVQRSLAWRRGVLAMPQAYRDEYVDSVPYGLRLYIQDGPWGTWDDGSF